MAVLQSHFAGRPTPLARWLLRVGALEGSRMEKDVSLFFVKVIIGLAIGAPIYTAIFVVIAKWITEKVFKQKYE